MGLKRPAGIVLAIAGMVIVAAGVAMPLTSDAETWWAPTIVGALIAIVGALVAWGWLGCRSLDLIT
jgi:hypothetical protein